MPAVASPDASATACCSAMPASMKRSGNLSRYSISPVPSGIAAVITITRGSFSASSCTPSPNHSVHVRPGLATGTTGGSTVGSTGTFSGFFFALPLAGAGLAARAVVAIPAAGDALALLGLHVQQHDAVELLDRLERLEQRRGVVAVDRAEVAEAQRLEQVARHHHVLDHLDRVAELRVERRADD